MDTLSHQENSQETIFWPVPQNPGAMHQRGQVPVQRESRPIVLFPRGEFAFAPDSYHMPHWGNILVPWKFRARGSVQRARAAWVWNLTPASIDHMMGTLLDAIDSTFHDDTFPDDFRRALLDSLGYISDRLRDYAAYLSKRDATMVFECLNSIIPEAITKWGQRRNGSNLGFYLIVAPTIQELEAVFRLATLRPHRQDGDELSRNTRCHRPPGPCPGGLRESQAAMPLRPVLALWERADGLLGSGGLDDREAHNVAPILDRHIPVMVEAAQEALADRNACPETWAMVREQTLTLQNYLDGLGTREVSRPALEALAIQGEFLRAKYPTVGDGLALH